MVARLLLTRLANWTGNLAVMQIEWPAKYGDIYRFFAGSVCNVCVSSPELIEVTRHSTWTRFTSGHFSFIIIIILIQLDCSQRPYSDGKRDRLRFIPLLIGRWSGEQHRWNHNEFNRKTFEPSTSLFTGDKWKQRRRLLAPAFHLKVLENFLPLFNEQSLVLCHQIEQRMEAAHGKMDVYPLFVHCTLDIICGNHHSKMLKWHYSTISEPSYPSFRCGYGYNGQRSNARLRLPSWHRQVLISINWPIKEAQWGMISMNIMNERVLQILMEEMRKPWLAIGCIFRLTSLGREKKALLETIHGFINDVSRVLHHGSHSKLPVTFFYARSSPKDVSI